jgi:hypothetical protein
VINRSESNIVSSATLGTFALTFVIMLALTVVVMQAAQAQTYTVIHNFAGGARDGSHPYNGVDHERKKSVRNDCQWRGRLRRICELAHQNTGWVFNLLYRFQGGNGSLSDGESEFPCRGMIFDQAGNLDGTTRQGGGTLIDVAEQTLRQEDVGALLYH